MAYYFTDPDGNFVEQFQTKGFDARIFELFLYAVLTELEFLLDRSHPVPDFNCLKFGKRVFIEAVTANPSLDESGSPKSVNLPELTEETTTIIQDFMAIKYGSALYSKLNKRYWDLPHVKGHPLILAIQDFHQPGSMVWSGSGLPRYLYGLEEPVRILEEGKSLKFGPVRKVESHTYEGKTIPSGFFFQPEAEHISGVLFSNTATISKFNRMGFLAGFGSRRVLMIRQGIHGNPDLESSQYLLQFRTKVYDPTYKEDWREGLSLFHNPRALYPVDAELFPGIAHHTLENDILYSDVPEFHPYGSRTIVLVEE